MTDQLIGRSSVDDATNVYLPPMERLHLHSAHVAVLARVHVTRTYVRGQAAEILGVHGHSDAAASLVSMDGRTISVCDCVCVGYVLYVGRSSRVQG